MTHNSTGKVEIKMAGISAVVFIPDDTSKTGYSRPLMLQRIMGSPLLSWLVSSLIADGVGRFFLVCHDRYLDEANSCFPADVELKTSMNENAADLLHVFLSTSEDDEEDVVVVTGPAIVLKSAATMGTLARPVPSCVYAVNRGALMQALDATEQFSFLDFLHSRGVAYTDRDGVFTVSSGEELASWQPLLNQHHLLQLVHSGVEIWDYTNCYVDPAVFVGSGTVILPGSILRGQSVVGKDCIIGPNAYLENAKIGDGSKINASQVIASQVGFDAQIGPYCHLGPNVSVGNGARIDGFASVKECEIGEDATIYPMSYLCHSDLGARTVFGSGATTIHDPEQSRRTVIENRAVIGANVNLLGAVTVAQDAVVAAGTTVLEDISPIRQEEAFAGSGKRDWLGKGKK